MWFQQTRDLKKTEIKTLEVGYTIPLSQPINTYLETFGDRSRFTKIDIKKKTLETVLYRTEARSFECYNKGIESKKNIPDLYKAGNLLRLELKYKKGFTKNFGKLTLWDLAKKDVYSKFVNNWKDFYDSIEKQQNIVIDTSQHLTPKTIEQAVTLIGARSYGHDKLLNLIGTLEMTGKMGQKQCQRFRAKIKSLKKDKTISKKSDLISELDLKVFEIASRV